MPLERKMKKKILRTFFVQQNIDTLFEQNIVLFSVFSALDTYNINHNFAKV